MQPYLERDGTDIGGPQDPIDSGEGANSEDSSGRSMLLPMESTMSRTMYRLILTMAGAVVLLTACASAPASSSPGSLYHCNRNGDREERVEC